MNPARRCMTALLAERAATDNGAWQAASPCARRLHPHLGKLGRRFH